MRINVFQLKSPRSSCFETFTAAFVASTISDHGLFFMIISLVHTDLHHTGSRAKQWFVFYLNESRSLLRWLFPRCVWKAKCRLWLKCSAAALRPHNNTRRHQSSCTKKFYCLVKGQSQDAEQDFLRLCVSRSVLLRLRAELQVDGA